MHYIVTVPICDLRREPVPHSRSYIKDPLQETQLLKDEYLIVHSTKDQWAFVEAIEQKKWVNDRWIGYPGWVKLNQIQIIEQNYKEKSQQSLTLAKRKSILDMGIKRFLHTPYLWGGHSFYDPKNQCQITGVDCSGLTRLLYYMHGIQLPRDAHDQYRNCQPIEFEQMKKADLIFLAETKRPERISHVMLYDVGDQILEATLDTGTIRLVTGKEKLGKMLKDIKSGERLEKYILFFGSVTTVA